MSVLLLLVTAVLLSQVVAQPARTFAPTSRFDPTSLEEAVYLAFGDNKEVIVRGRGGLSTADIEYSSGTTDQARPTAGGFTFGVHDSGFLSIHNPDFRGRGFLDLSAPGVPAFESGLLFKIKMRFGNYSQYCERCSATMPHTTCTNRADEYPVGQPDFAGTAISKWQTIFAVASEQITFWGLQLERKIVARSVLSQNCDTTPMYSFRLTRPDGGAPLIWTVYSASKIWLDDGLDHTILFALPRNNGHGNLRYPLLYVDGQYICAPQALTTSSHSTYCKSTEGVLAAPTPFHATEADLTRRCSQTRIYFGSQPEKWDPVQNPLASSSQPRNFRQFLTGSTLKQFTVWNYLGALSPSDSFLCGVSNTCFYYKNSPWCRNTDPTNDIPEIRGLTKGTSCTISPALPTCGSLLTASNCQWPGNACVTGTCCHTTMGKCVPLGTNTDCGSCGDVCSGSSICCNNRCVNPLADAQNCYGCGNVCEASQICCGNYRGCTGRDVNCDSTCLNNCLTLTSSNPGTDYHCCRRPNSAPGSYCVDFKGNNNDDCGACGNKCSLRDNPATNQVFQCCSGTCVQIGDNENCAMCGDVCKNGPGDRPRACCNMQCTDLDSDDNCGSCGHSCVELGRQAGKNYHCCDGLCVEWNTLQTQCGCPATNCEQEYNLRLGVTTYHCCADANPPTTLPVCLDFNSEMACGGCGNVCTPGLQKCCADPMSLRVCSNLNAEDSCGDCGVNCGPKNVDSPKYCCGVVVAGKTQNTCTAFGTRDNCGACGDVCGAPKKCCLLAPVDIGAVTAFGCKTIYNDVHYCGDSCTDCTAGGTISNVLCCKGKCVEVLNTDDSCGCDDVRACSVPGSKCCLPPNGIIIPGGLPDLHTCTALRTMTNCADCNNVCDASINQACCANSATTSFCSDLMSDMLNCGKCGRVCDSLTERCCSGECRSILEHDNCGACGVQCGSNTLCCNDAGSIMCVPYLNSANACGCPHAPSDCTLLIAPPENHDGKYTCCKGHCFPTWENCMD